MKSFILLSLLGTFALAQIPAKKCQCPQFKCPATESVALCQCLNGRETLCHNYCPEYVPNTVSCPTKPATTPTPAPATALPSINPAPCECDAVFCAQSWPESCYCGNANKQACFDKCGGVQPQLQNCPPLETPIIITSTTAIKKSSTSTSTRKPTSSSTTKPSPSPTTALPANGTHAICGGGRPDYNQCTQPNYVCIKDPYKSDCGPECDGTGICVEDRMCGGFAGFSCPAKGQVCVDDPRDGADCDPKLGAADCGGLCVWPH